MGIGASWLEPDTSEVQGVDVNDRVNTGNQFTLGADITKHLSLELHTADLGSAGLSPTGRINYAIHGGSALIYAGKNRHRHVRRGLTGYGRIGFGTLDDSAVGDVDYVEDNGTHVLLGAGLEYATRMGLGVRAEFISFDADVRYGQLGLIYRMGGDHGGRRPVRVAEAPQPEPAPMPERVRVPEPITPSVPALQITEMPVYTDQCTQFNGVLEGVNFHSDSARLTDSAQMILDTVASELALCEGTPIAIAAHTDNQGSAAYNEGLSKRRAISVAKYLAERGIDLSRMKARAFGESKPIQSNDTAEGRLRNRRVELVAQ